MNVLPSLSVISVPGHPEYSIIQMQCLERVGLTEDGRVPLLWQQEVYVKLDITDVDPAESAKVIATCLNTISEQLEADDYNTYQPVTKDAAYGHPYVM